MDVVIAGSVRTAIGSFCGVAGIPIECSSGVKAVALTAQAIRAGVANLIVAGGVESVSTAPYIATDARWGHRLGNMELVGSLVFDGLSCSLSGNVHMGTTAET